MNSVHLVTHENTESNQAKNWVRCTKTPNLAQLRTPDAHRPPRGPLPAPTARPAGRCNLGSCARSPCRAPAIALRARSPCAPQRLQPQRLPPQRTARPASTLAQRHLRAQPSAHLSAARPACAPTLYLFFSILIIIIIINFNYFHQYEKLLKITKNSIFFHTL